ncbi:hypothetical protein OGATHE_006524 [Ogataea polymorpha]|uniref:Uncharacterized protein n=1 Tax=Ogataea polymorpha TaxID=460523 RepID=A0A9P8NRF5_9ASCO|nr:hypothetical protein OGATHE_006524 [Ogataea polymorpha]
MSEADILRRDTSIMEGVQSHLSSRFTNGLSSNDTHHLTWIHKGFQKLLLYGSQNPLKCIFIQSEFFKNSSGGQSRTDKALEQQGGIFLSLCQNLALSTNDFEFL